MKNRKYKIAYCLVGIVGYTEPQGRGKPVDFRIAHKYNKENIFGDNDVDVFIHSWSTDFKDDLIKLYKPLPSEYKLFDTLTVCTKVGETHAYEIKFTEDLGIIDDIAYLRGPNVNINIKDKI